MKLEIQQVSKQYAKGKYGVKDLSLTLENGVFGLLGPNGAGKSTLLKMIATVSKPSNGVIYLNKNNIIKDPNFARKTIGFLPQDFGVYPNLNAFEFLRYIAAMKGVAGPKLETRITQLIEGLNLMAVAKQNIGRYSGGMKQRVGIAQALLNDPKLIIFDEPTVGLDPDERVGFRHLVAELASEAIVILSSHIVSDIATISDRVGIMKEGQLLAQGEQHEIIKTTAGKVFEIEIDKDFLPVLKEKHIVINVAHQSEKLKVRYISDHPLDGSVSQEANLEDSYLHITKR